VPNSACPLGWSGVAVTTDTAAEITYLDDIPACRDASGSATYLKNNSDAVWTLRSTTTSGTVTPSGQNLVEWSFVQAVSDARPGLAIFVPGAEVTVDLPPESIVWAIDLPLSIGFQGHEVVLGKLRQGGEAAAVAALRRQSPAGGALAACTFSVVQAAESVSDLEDADAVDVVLAGLGVGTASSACRTAAVAVGTLDGASQPIALADEIDRLTAQTDVLERIQTRAGNAQRVARVLNFFRLLGPG
jgi:hypothetical protein